MDLVEREGALAVLRAALDAARADSGQVLLVGAEAGGGKTSVVEAFLAALPGGVLVKRGWCDGLSTPRPLGPFLDMAGQELAVRLEAGATRTDVLGATFALVDDAGPLVMVIEDLHWADEATLDAVRFIARRISQTRTVLILTYRDDEVVDAHPAQELLGELGTNRAAQRLPLPSLTLAGVSALIDGTGLDPAVVLETTGGNPFFVSEVLRAEGEELPASARDAVLARAARLSPPGREVLDAAALVKLLIEGKEEPPGPVAKALNEPGHVLPPLPNLFFTRDSCMVVGDHVMIGSMRYAIRWTEAIIMKALFVHHPELANAGILYDGSAERRVNYTVEGGDVHPLRRDLVVIGFSERSSPAAIDQLASTLFEQTEVCDVIVVVMPKESTAIHLDMIFTQVDRELCAVFPPHFIGPERLPVLQWRKGESMIRECPNIFAAPGQCSHA